MNFKLVEGNWSMTKGGFMKMLNQFNVPLKLLKASNCAGLNLNETPKELEKYNL